MYFKFPLQSLLLNFHVSDIDTLRDIFSCLIFSSEDVKQLAQEVCESIQSTMGTHNFVQVYSQVRKQLKAKRDKRKQEEKLMAVVNPMRNAKRKLRVAAKHRANKKRKVMTLRMGRWKK